MISSTFMLALIMLFIKHPLSMGLMIICQSILIAFISGSFYYNFWFSYLMFIVVVGGMMVLFIYMTTIASNEAFNMSKNLIICMIPLMIILPMILDKTLMNTPLNSYSKSLSHLFLNSINKFMNFPSNSIMIMVIIYLFIALIAVVKITNITSGPLRQKF